MFRMKNFHHSFDNIKEHMEQKREKKEPTFLSRHWTAEDNLYFVVIV